LWEFKVKSIKKKKKNGPAHEGPPIKPVKPVARELLNFKPVKPTGKPVNRSEPVARENLNLFEFGFKFNRFPA